MPNVRIMRRTTVFGVYDGGTYGALERVNDHVAGPAGARAAAADLENRRASAPCSRRARSSAASSSAATTGPA